MGNGLLARITGAVRMRSRFSLRPAVALMLAAALVLALTACSRFISHEGGSAGHDAQTVNYSYDDDSILTGVGDLTLSPDPTNGLLRATSMASGSTDHVTTSLSYNGFGELDVNSAAHGSTALFAENVTDRDALGRIEEKTETTSQGPDTYRYAYEADTGFLDTVHKNDQLIANYEYDANGNRESKASGGVTVTGSYDDQDRLASYGTNTYTYTEAGDLESKADGTHTTNYAYDELGSLENVTLEAETQTPIALDYVNDGFGRRIAKKRGGNLRAGLPLRR